MCTTKSDGGRTFMVAVSPCTRGVPPAGSNSLSSNASHYNHLTTVEWLLGVGSTGHFDKPTLSPPLKGLFDFAPAHGKSVTSSGPVAGPLAQVRPAA